MAPGWIEINSAPHPAFGHRTSRSQLDRILGDQGSGMTLETLSRAIDALGLRIRLEMQGKDGSGAIVRKGAAKKTRRAAVGTTVVRKPAGRQAAARKHA